MREYYLSRKTRVKISPNRKFTPLLKLWWKLRNVFRKFFLTISLFFFSSKYEKPNYFSFKEVEFEEVCKLFIVIAREVFFYDSFSYLHIVNSPISFRDSCKVTKLSIKTKSKDKYSHSPKLASSSIIDQFLWEPHFFLWKQNRGFTAFRRFPPSALLYFFAFYVFPPSFFLT